MNKWKMTTLKLCLERVKVRKSRNAESKELSMLSKGSEGFIKQHMYVVNVHASEAIKVIQFPIDLTTLIQTSQVLPKDTEILCTSPWLL